MCIDENSEVVYLTAEYRPNIISVIFPEFRGGGVGVYPSVKSTALVPRRELSVSLSKNNYCTCRVQFAQLQYLRLLLTEICTV